VFERDALARHCRRQCEVGGSDLRALIWTIAAIGVVIAATPATAQTYDPNYPVCLQAYAPEGGYIHCSCASMTASGRGALPQPVFRATRAASTALTEGLICRP